MKFTHALLDLAATAGIAIIVALLVQHGYIRYDYYGLHIGPPAFTSGYAFQNPLGSTPWTTPGESYESFPLPAPRAIPKSRPRVYITPHRPCDDPDRNNTKQLEDNNHEYCA